ncbi:MAG: glucose-6-phosphate isomerase [Thermogutta sp.]
MAEGNSVIRYDASGVILGSTAAGTWDKETGLLPDDVRWIWPRLLSCRDEVLADVETKVQGRPVPPEKDPLDSRFVDLPERLLGSESRLVEQWIATADRFASKMDRIVVLGIGGSYMGARAMFEACCHPYHNELSRDKRNGRPRIYFEGNNVDSDGMRGLLQLLEEGGSDWGILVISKSGSTLETAVAFRVFVDALRSAAGDRFAERIAAVSQQGSRLWRLCQALGVPRDQLFEFPEDVGGRFSVLTAVGLLPAAILGLDVRGLLQGAAAANAAFRRDAFEENPVLAYTAVCHLMEMRRQACIRVLSTWGKRLEAVGLWYDQLLSESLGKNGQGATPLTVVNTRDLHSRGQQHQEGRRDKLFTNLYVQTPSFPPLPLPQWEHDHDELNSLTGKTVSDVLTAARLGTKDAYAQDRRRTAEIVVPRLDERAIGELFQMLMLATAVEGRLIGINPYGQPGVEAYKRCMRAYLQKNDA